MNLIIWYEECSFSGDHYEHAMTPNDSTYQSDHILMQINLHHQELTKKVGLKTV